MDAREGELDRLLELIEQRIEGHPSEIIDERYRRTLTCQPVDRPPLVVRVPFGNKPTLPPPWDHFTLYPHRQAYDDPVAMMHNQLLLSVVPGLVTGDDSPMLIRNDHGIIQIASLLGARWRMLEDNPPWAYPLGSIEALEAVASGDTQVDLANGGVLTRSFQTLRFYHRKLDEYPNCRQSIQIAMPDLQGPLDTAEQLWGQELFVAFYEQPQLVDRLLSRIANMTLAVAERFRVLATDRLDPLANAQHAWMIRGRLLIRNDTAILLSPQTYADQVRPHDARVLKEIGGGSMHFCGDGQHLFDPMFEIPDLHGFDFGHPHWMDIAKVYRRALPREVAMVPLRPAVDELTSGKAGHDFPTGVVFAHEMGDLDEARTVVEAYQAAMT